MAKAKINNVDYENLETTIFNASQLLDDFDGIWCDHFDDLYAWFITSRFLDDLYKDAESAYFSWKKGLNFVSCTVGATALGLTFGPIGGIIGFVIGLVFGIYETVTNNPTWITVSKEAFEQLLTNCACGNDDNYIKMTNLMTWMFNTKVSLEEIRTLINNFNHEFANLNNAMDAMGLKAKMAGDGVTVLGIETTVTWYF